MSEASIVLKVYDQMSETLKSIDGNSAALNKEFELQRRKLQQLGEQYENFNRQAGETAAEAIETKKAMYAASKAFKRSGDEADKAKFTKLRREYRELTDAAKAYDDAAAKTRKAMRETADVSKKTGGGLGSGDGSSGLLSSLGKAGMLKMAGDIAGQWAGVLAGSAFGDKGGAFFGGALNGAGSGAAIGSMVAPGVGTAVGALLGAGIGAIGAGTQVYQGKDNAFKSYVQEAVEEQLTDQRRSIQDGSAIAAGRETDRISLNTMFGSVEKANTYLNKLVEMANDTPFLYGDLMSMTKVLGSYGYNDSNILPVLQAIGDTGAAKGWGTADMSTAATALGRMKSSGKVSIEYLNMLNDRGVNAVGMLAEAKGVSQGKMYDMISKGKIAGDEAVEIILQAMVDSFSGSMLEQSRTFSGLSSTVEGLSQELDNAMGEAFNAERKKGLEAQRDWLSGETGNSLIEANKAIGAWKASLENAKEEAVRSAVNSTMESEEYSAAKASGDAAEMGRLIMEAKVRGMSEYNASDGAQLALESEKSLIDAIRNDASSNQGYWDAGYQKSQEYAMGLASGLMNHASNFPVPSPGRRENRPSHRPSRRPGSHASGLARVPYDNYPALLHEGEKVLTAAQARSDSGGNVTITGNTFVVRQESDINAIGAALAREIRARRLADGR